MKRSATLGIDAAINIALGVLLVFFPRQIVETLGVPASSSAFYPSILGAVLTGIGIALCLQITRRERPEGLGLRGAIAINLCGGFVLAAWLLWGGLDVPLRGRVFLWSLAAVLLSVSFLELAVLGTHDEL